MRKDLEFVVKVEDLRKVDDIVFRGKEYDTCVSFKIGKTDGENSIYHHVDNEFFGVFYYEPRIELQKKWKLTKEELGNHGLGLFLRNSKYSFTKQLHVGDDVKVYSIFARIKDTDLPKLRAVHKMVRNGELINTRRDELVIVGLEAESHLTSLNDYPIIKSQFESIGYQTRVF
ncbi:hypothetical protein HOC35_06925 [Candidatus Woesearchaeota archaeon]|jgi:acyl-CoA thioesterase FadM|nr:hypothetical protein [Candidatus Woesearchaeota archaeon]